MSQGLDYARYEQYVADAAGDFEAEGPWSVRRLSPSELEHVGCAGARESGLRKRWEDRLALGYDREKSRLANEVEELFAEIPVADETSGTCDQAA